MGLEPRPLKPESFLRCHAAERGGHGLASCHTGTACRPCHSPQEDVCACEFVRAAGGHLSAQPHPPSGHGGYYSCLSSA